MKLAELIEEVVDKGTTTVEEIHRAIAQVPTNILERAELFETATGEVKRLQDASIGAIYDVIRDVNHKLAAFVMELLDHAEREPASGDTA
jgi:uncharacterized protein YaaR (DUF327 family)